MGTIKQKVLDAMQLCPNGDFEFCWLKSRYKNQKIIPDDIRHQGNCATCVFEAVSAGGEMALLKKKADEDPPRTTSIRLKSSSLAQGYQREIGVQIGDDIDAENKAIREDTALLLFKRDGIEATDGRRVKLIDSWIQREPTWIQIANHILQGRPVLGTVIAGDEFNELGPDQVYEFHPHTQEGEPKKVYNHMVLFMGYGVRDHLGFLKFINCRGTGFGDKGFGRIYFEYVHPEKLYVLYGAEVVNEDEAGGSTSSATQGGSTSSATQGGSTNTHPADTRRRRGRGQGHEDLLIPWPAQRRRGSSLFRRRRNPDHDELHAESGSSSASDADD